MSEINNGGPAFPHDERAQHNERDGMTLRDYFAAKAMTGLLGSESVLTTKAFRLTCDMDVYKRDFDMLSVQALRDEIARDAYRMADAMIAAREAQW